MTQKTSTMTADPRQAEKKKRPTKKISPRYLQNYALYYLNRYAASSAHLKTILMRRVDRSLKYHDEPSHSECEAMVDAVIVRYNENGILNDETYARSQAIAYRRKGWSYRQTVAKLIQKGVTKDIAEAMLRKADADDFNHKDAHEADMDAAFQYARKKRLSYWGIEERQADYEGYEKSLARLARRGFSYDVCKAVLEAEALKHNK